MLLDQGIDRVGARVVAQKRALLFDKIKIHLAEFPVRKIDPDIGICAYPVSKTPFVVLYDYDNAELRVHLVIHAHADRTKVDLSKVVW